MTFVDAAIEVLKREGQPLTIRRLAELAVKHNLLSVIGRDPEATMLERLDEAMARSAHHPQLVRVRPDTFGLHVYPPKPEPAAAPAAGEAKAAGGAEEPKKGRRRRRRGGRRGDGPEAAGGAAVEGDEAAEGDDEADAAGAEATGAAEATATATAKPAAGDAAAAAGDAAAAPAATGDAAVEATPAAGGEKRRRRRGGRGRRRREGAPGVAEAADGGEAEDEADATADEAPSLSAPAASDATAAPDAAEAAATDATREGSAAMAELSAQTSVPADDDAGGAAAPPIPSELPTEAAAAGSPSDEELEGLDEDEALEIAEDLDAEFDHDTGPLLAPAHGAEDVTRTDDDRVVRPEIRGSRDERHRRDHRHKRGDRRDGKPHDRDGKPHDKAAGHKPGAPQERPPHDRAAHERPQHERAAHERPQPDRPQHDRAAAPHAAHAPAGRAPATTAPEAPREGKPVAGLLGAVLEVLRASDGRPMHVRHIAEAAVERHLVDARIPPNDLVRLVRTTLAAELREREASGLRPRLRSVGGGQYQPADKRLDPELGQAERELAERAARLADSTRAVMRRRIGRLAPPAFEALGRTLCDKLGIAGVELIRRGEGVAYFGGSRVAGAGSVRTLVALRPSESEVNRRAVGELRAGLAAKGFDEGLLFAGGTPNAEALAELKHGGVTLYDGPALAALLIDHGLGVRRVALPVDYLDLEFFAELTEG